MKLCTKIHHLQQPQTATDTKGHEINTQVHHTIEINLPYRMITKRSQVQNEAYNSISINFKNKQTDLGVSS